MATIGTDPEFFLRDSRTGTAFPAVGLIGGTKEEPLPIPGLEGRTGYAMQEDNVMVEFNVPHTSNAGRFARHVSTALDFINRVVCTTGLPVEIDRESCARLFSHEALNNPQAQLFGCSPDYNAHRQGAPCPVVKPVELEERDGAWRFAGGHIHIGYNREKSGEIPDFCVAALADIFLGLSFLSRDTQGMRRSLYGQAGRYRPTDYGIEYRTLSNFWIWDAMQAQGVAQRAVLLGSMIEHWNEDEIRHVYTEVPWPDVQSAINNEDIAMASSLLDYCRETLGLEV